MSSSSSPSISSSSISLSFGSSAFLVPDDSPSSTMKKMECRHFPNTISKVSGINFGSRTTTRMRARSLFRENIMSTI
uniref:Uncharacterized protein n=1 Tax=Arundo donax TaxID=35708 RepID=A0A0A8ZYL3_ARUDO